MNKFNLFLKRFGNQVCILVAVFSVLLFSSRIANTQLINSEKAKLPIALHTFESCRFIKTITSVHNDIYYCISEAKT